MTAVRTTDPGPALAGLTTLRLGGPARRLVEARTEDELVAAVLGADAAGQPVLVLGGGSNLVVADEGFAGVAVLVATRGVERLPGGGTAGGRVHLRVAAGEPWDELVARVVAEGLSGLECLSGIPGSTGATPVQNVGAYGQEVGRSVVEVRALDRRTREVVALGPGDCGFAYRTSAFKGTDRYVVLAVTFALEESGRSTPVRYLELARALGVELGEQVPAARVREAVLALRRGKGMVVDPDDPESVSAGSFFTNPVLDASAAADLPAGAPRWPQPDGTVKTSAAWLIGAAGFERGHAPAGPDGPRISRRHTLALVNGGAATTDGLVALAREIRDGVRARFGIELVPEPVLVGRDW